VVVLAADVVRIVSLPSERDPILLVHANAVLPLAISGQRLQAMAVGLEFSGWSTD
jgi:hypothetical protein